MKKLLIALLVVLGFSSCNIQTGEIGIENAVDFHTFRIDWDDAEPTGCVIQDVEGMWVYVDSIEQAPDGIYVHTNAIHIYHKMRYIIYTL